jgi:NADPH2:quinone reductase
MRALIMSGFGEPSQAKLGDVPKPDISPGDLLVRMGAAALNPVDWKEIAGHMASFYPPYPPQWVPGFDGSGLVEAVGAAVTGFAPGDHVLVRPDRMNGNGTLAEFVRVPQDKAAKAPQGLSHAQTASIATAGSTAYQALFRLDMAALKAGQCMFVEGGAGGVGGFAVSFARAAGVRTAATCRRENVDYVIGLGAELAIEYERADVVGEVRRWLPGGVDVVLDCYSGGQRADLLDALAPGGCLVVVATLIQDADIPQLSAAAEKRGLTVRLMLMDFSRLQTDAANIARLLEDGSIRFPEVRSYPLERAVEALEAVRAGGLRGKVAVELMS